MTDPIRVTSDHVPPDPPRKHANLFERFDYLVKAALWLIEDALNTRHQMEQVMTNLSGLQSALADFKGEVATHATKIDTELAQLLAAQGSGDQAAVDAAVQLIRDQTAALQALDVQLDADDPAAPTT